MISTEDVKLMLTEEVRAAETHLSVAKEAIERGDYSDAGQRLSKLSVNAAGGFKFAQTLAFRLSEPPK